MLSFCCATLRRVKLFLRRGIVMHFERATLETCGAAIGAVVVIDVIRAFTTAAFAFAAGAREIVLTSAVEEALALRAHFPGALVMGEVDGLPVEGFDFSNSPAELIGRDLGGRRMIQRTSAGTQGWCVACAPNCCSPPASSAPGRARATSGAWRPPASPS